MDVLGSEPRERLREAVWWEVCEHRAPHRTGVRREHLAGAIRDAQLLRSSTLNT